MKTHKLKASEAGPIPAPALTPVLSLRDVDGRDIWPGIYRAQDGAYVAVKCRDGVPVGPVTNKLTVQGAFGIYRKLLARVRPGMDVWRDGEARLLQEVSDLVPEEPEKRLYACIRAGWGTREKEGVFTDYNGRFYTGVQKENDGEITDLQRVTVAEASKEAAEIWESCTDADISGMPELLERAAARLKSVEKRKGVTIQIELSDTTNKVLRKAASREGVEPEQIIQRAIHRDYAPAIDPVLRSSRPPSLAGN